ncbi:MAG: putative symporter YjmB [Chloroflexi bacterium ADurb.Bin120]|jgi:GPH family glycoside/pentoside/hexuronide:cation symporter|uniref:Putative Sugar (Glycoside-Pentoside-Hexuronide) transporter n=1 Tax=Candidatus Brevifilum fermentans TaxID=1986204 RepID=A0A1Y6K176_9CHLR|nr:MFS transporter [Brevefilum fermentans]OQB84660.1 MAG: putative symporter YjmB [Chloroflexi bacterium ADurb.Bin120]SMX53442.1 putative Sugar (Glycoside-Pentoside-Hexuronide) transporter [Brevefilum fermentans]HOM67244.1 MFS transporter [Brevefilum fermentans]
MEKKEKLPFITNILYGMGDFGFSMNNSIISAFFSVFLVTVVGVAPGLVAIILFVGRSWDFVNDLLVGYISDRTRTRWGRRRPFLLFGTVPFGLSFLLLWLHPNFGQTGLVIYYSLAYIIYEALATFVYMPYFALTPELTSDYDERTKLTSFRMMFNITGSLTAYILPLLIVGNDWTQATSRNVIIMAVAAGALAAAPYFGVFFGTKEKKEYQSEKLPKFWPSLKAAFKNKPFVFGALMYLATWMAIIVIESNLQFFILHIIRRQSQNIIIMVSIFVTAIFALPFWNWVSKNWNKRRAYIIGVGFWSMVMIVLIFMNPQTPFWLILILCVLAGIGVSAGQVLPWAIIPDAIEWEEWHTGERNEGIFYSLVTLLGKIGMAIAQPLSLLVLQISNLQTGQDAVQPPSALLGIRLVVGPIPAMCLIAGILIAIFYPLERTQHRQIVDDLRTRRAALKAKRT